MKASVTNSSIRVRKYCALQLVPGAQIWGCFPRTSFEMYKLCTSRRWQSFYCLMGTYVFHFNSELHPDCAEHHIDKSLCPSGWEHGSSQANTNVVLLWPTVIAHDVWRYDTFKHPCFWIHFASIPAHLYYKTFGTAISCIFLTLP